MFDRMADLDGAFLHRIRLRLRHWKAEGYRRIAKSHEAEKSTGKIPTIEEFVSQQNENTQEPVRHPSAAEQIEQLRNECRLTVEQLADEVGLDPRSVYRHLGGTKPRIGHIGAYERVFSKILKRNIVINIPSARRQPNVT